MIHSMTIEASLIVIIFLVFYFIWLWHYLHRKSRSSSPLDSKLRKFSYRELKNATNNFNASNSIGEGGSGTVFRGILSDGNVVAVKLLDSNILFQNELKILSGIKPSHLVVSLKGFCVEKDKRLLVFDYMSNGSLQEYLFFDSTLDWGLRFTIILDVAKAISFLHLECHPPVLHGDVKPSNVLLDSEFRAKLSDFGLSRFKTQDLSGNLNANGNDNFALALQASKNSNKIHHHNSNFNGLSVDFNFNSKDTSKGKELHEDWNKFMPYDDRLSSLEHCKELNSCLAMLSDGISSSEKQLGKDRWWRQKGSGELCSKDYVTEWTGSQISPNSSTTPCWNEEKGSTQEIRTSNSPKNLEKHESYMQEPRVECFDNGARVGPKKRLKMHEWWGEENLEEIRKKGNKARRVKVPHFGLGKYFEFRSIWRKSVENENINDGKGNQNPEFSFRIARKKKQKQHIHSAGSDMWSGDLFSPELSRKTSVRGTLCYVAPEYNGFGYLIEKADIYSLGVLILVIVSGRRPMHVLASPMRLEKANLISWTRRLSCSGGCVLDLVDEKMKGQYSKEEASLCINLALACLQKVPEMRPNIGDVVKVLRGEMELPPLPFEFSPSPPSRVFSTSRMRRNGGLD